VYQPPKRKTICNYKYRDITKITLVIRAQLGADQINTDTDAETDKTSSAAAETKIRRRMNKPHDYLLFLQPMMMMTREAGL